MRVTRDVDLGESRAVQVKELTTGEVRTWFERLKNQETQFDVFDESLLEGISLTDFGRMTDLTPEGMDELTPRELESVVAACREVNPHFFTLRDRILLSAAKLLDLPQPPS